MTDDNAKKRAPFTSTVQDGRRAMTVTVHVNGEWQGTARAMTVADIEADHAAMVTEFGTWENAARAALAAHRERTRMMRIQ